ncbi:MAG: hypothetical protein GX251_11265 [Firmicutes bacterium]|nr:hypothetical protein [Bacillota bacterium]
MLMKGVGAGLILFSTGAMGMILARSFSIQVHNLRQLISFIQVLESEIQFAKTTLPNVIAAEARQSSGDIGRFLQLVNKGLAAGTGERFSVIWEEGLNNLAANGLPAAVLEDLHHVGEVLGMSDTAEQVKHLKVAMHRLGQALETAEQEREKQARLWQYLGFSAGLLIILLLF